MPEQPRSIIAGTEGDHPDVAAAGTAAAEAFATYRATPPHQRGDFLDAVAAEIESDKDAIVEAAVAESNLPEGRIAGEVGRTTGQLRMFADVVRRGDHLGVRIDPALPRREPLPRADIRQRHVAVGPVAVFGASNFPLAFSTAGGDTASALAAGCPVVVKAHPAHPRTGHLVARAVTRAVEKAGLQPGTFSFLLAADARSGIELGQELVSNPSIKAVGFTGSRGAGLALVAAAAARPEPIPVYAEMCRSTPWWSSPARSPRATWRRSPRRTSARSRWVPASSAPTLVCSSCRPAMPATRSSTRQAPPSPRRREPRC